jgi:hypothetical protein
VRAEVRKGAKLSDCGTYRYVLWRDWRDSTAEPLLMFVMLNPSTADADNDDPTIRKCKGFTERADCKGFLVLNLFAYRATDPTELVKAHRSGVDVIGPDNRYWHRCYVGLPDQVVAAWGAHALAPYGMDELSDVWRRRFVCLGTTKAAAPRHPLYVSYEQQLIPFPSPWFEVAA